MHGISPEITSETLQTPIKTLARHFEQKDIFIDISLLRLGKNMSIALQNMTESQKNEEKNSIPSIVKSLVLD